MIICFYNYCYYSNYYNFYCSDRNVDVAEDGLNGTYVQNATHKRVTDAAECTSLFRQGWANRTKSQTDFESRATVFFTLDITMVRNPGWPIIILDKLSIGQQCSIHYYYLHQVEIYPGLYHSI